jgi:hypothetical protein
VTVRPATTDDLPAITALTGARRRQLANWEPWYWNPRAGIDELHPLYLGWCLEHNDACEVVVAVDGIDDVMVGCVFAHRRPDHVFLDDFCVVEDRWTDVGATLAGATADGQGLMCVPARDRSQRDWLTASDSFTWVSTFFSVRVEGLQSTPASAPSAPLPDVLASPPAHVFGLFGVDTENGLRVSTVDGYAVGSAPASPPAYDPGGPTTVIDRVVGPNRRGVVDEVLRAASDRGDVQVIFVVDRADQELAEIVGAVGATEPVHLWRAYR